MAANVPGGIMNLLNLKINNQMRDAGIPRKMRGQEFPIFLKKEIALLVKEEEKKILSFLINDGKIRNGRDETILFGYNHNDQYIQFARNIDIPEKDYQTLLKNIQKRGFNALISIGKLFSWIEERDWNKKGFSASCSGRGIEYSLKGVQIFTEEGSGYTSSKVTNSANFNLNEKIEVKFVGFAGSECFKADTERFFGIKFPNIHKWR